MYVYFLIILWITVYTFINNKNTIEMIVRVIQSNEINVIEKLDIYKFQYNNVNRQIELRIFNKTQLSVGVNVYKILRYLYRHLFGQLLL